MSQCRMVTNKNERCKRQAIHGRSFCWQHESRIFKGITVSGLLGLILILIGLFADLSALGFPIPTLAPIPTATSSLPDTAPSVKSPPDITSASTPTLLPTITTATVTPWAGPCTVDDFVIRPEPPQPVGTLISIVIKTNCIGDVRAIRLMVNGEWYNEKGGHIAPPNEFGLNWQTKDYFPGEYQLTAEVATWGDDNWEYSAKKTSIYLLTEP